MLKEVMEHLNHPPMEFRGVPFWSWNGKLEETELRRQIRVMKEMGFGGFFMHSRLGLATEYLSEEWFSLVNACIDEAGKQGLSAWLYDEDRYSSGSAGGEVGREKQFRLRTLNCEILSETDFRGGDVAHFAGRVEGNSLFSPRRLHPGDSLMEGESFLRFFTKDAPLRDWDNNSYAPDLMNPEAVRKFIEVTHEKYAREIPGDFGRTVPGIFTDEPNYSNWTDAVVEETRKRYGYDLLDHLPELFFVVDGEECSRIRLNHYEIMTDLFVKSFSKQIGEWCGKHNLMFTGHVLCEDSLVSQSVDVGSAMRFYEYMQAPGIDLLTEHWTIYDTAKQCVSMARQFGRKIRLSETYGCTGWDFPFLGHKALGDWQASRNQSALSASCLVLDGGGGKTGLSGQHLLSVAVVPSLSGGGGLLCETRSRALRRRGGPRSACHPSDRVDLVRETDLRDERCGERRREQPPDLAPEHPAERKY